MQGDQSLPLWGDAQDQGVDFPDFPIVSADKNSPLA